jgi:isoleucyl-tRNA synthetase
MFKDTIFLPKTNFPMKAGLPEKERSILERWKQLDLYNLQRKTFKGRPKFVLHDGPPYANGHIHIGHALNRILKDVVIRSRQMQGKDCVFIPGWDCHGLPIEWKIEEEYRSHGKSKDEVDVIEFRNQCRTFAKKWVELQKEEIQRLGVLGDWDNSYTTMKFENEAIIASELSKFLMNGSLYRGFRPVMWSVVEKTALAEAEVEYQDKISPSIYVKFPIKNVNSDALKNAYAIIWTTTPWTLPANRAIAYGDKIRYVVIEVNSVMESTHMHGYAIEGEKLLIAEDLVPAVCSAVGIAQHTVLTTLAGVELQGVSCLHPFAGQGYEFEVPMLPGDHVSTDAGTGLVHTAPSHGVEDFALGKAFGLEIPDLIQDDGVYRPQVSMFAGLHIFKANEPVIEALKAANCLLGVGKIKHSYPHSWRSKAPLIYRTTPQWFISMETNNLRKKAVQAIDNVQWYPSSGKNRISSMIEGRPDWCVSRQRTWGVPLPIFVHKETNEILKDDQVQQRIVDAFRAEGADAWFVHDNAFFLEGLYPAEDYQKIKDVVDVWFDSGTTHVFTLEHNPEVDWPADLYLEGSDQHRGWFQSSLLESCGTRGVAPYKSVVTHGFVLDEKGYKMSKSLGNVISPADVIKDLGADILRLWVINSDYFDDIRIGKSILQHQQDIYRRFRNTLRYLLGALDGFSEVEKVDYTDLPSLEKWVLHRLAQLDNLRKTCLESYDFKTFYAELHTFCASELSSLYFDIRKDCLYCDDPKSLKRKAARTVMDLLFDTITRWLAPVLCFTAEEAYLERYPNKQSIHLENMMNIPVEWTNKKVGDIWHEIFDIRSHITSALELKRAEKFIGSSLQARVSLTLPTHLYASYVDLKWDEISIVSQINVFEGEDIKVEVQVAEGQKCERCWKVMPEVTEEHPVCDRCNTVVKDLM